MTKPLAFIYIVESPSADDIYDGRIEGGALCKMLKLADIPTIIPLL